MGAEKLVIDIVDNGGQWTHREWRMLRYLDVDTKIIPNDTPVNELRNLYGLLLSGGAARVGLTGELGNCGAYLELEIPILGICAGHQFMARIASVSFNPRQKWYRKKGMCLGELLIFQTVRTPHSSANLIGVEKKVRRSIEMRCIAHTENLRHAIIAMQS